MTNVSMNRSDKSAQRLSNVRILAVLVACALGAGGCSAGVGEGNGDLEASQGGGADPGSSSGEPGKETPITNESSAAPEGAANQGDLESQIQVLLERFPEATRLDENSISWKNGSVVLVLPTQENAVDRSSPAEDGESVSAVTQPLASRDAHGCPDGWYCLYQDADWNPSSPFHNQGRRLQFQDCNNDLSDYGFENQASSWVNNGQRTLQVWDLVPNKRLWTMEPQALSANVGTSKNDKADYVRCP